MKQNLCRFLVILFSLVGIMPVTVYANSAQPPALVIIMKNAPEDDLIHQKERMAFVNCSLSSRQWKK